MRSASNPEWHDMQGLVLSAYPHLDGAAYCLGTIDHPPTTQAWLARHVKWITNATRHRERVAPNEQSLNLNIAFTYTGLLKLCENIQRVPVGFSTPFVEGIDGREYRRRILGDLGQPEWVWGGKKPNPVDVLVMLFATPAVRLPDVIDELFRRSGMRVMPLPLYARSLKTANGREHFGFIDGISQPVLRGTQDAERFPESTHLTEVGEIVLGYPDALDLTPDSPDLRPVDQLQARGGHNPQLAPPFGRNGSYLVFRQLRQYVDEFNSFVAAAAGTPGNPNSKEAILLASKMVGRNRADGRPLVPYVNFDDNEFNFEGDPHGNGCPIGAHIRRANPRDSTSTELAQHPRNRHRVLRRGRS
jgi:hypothetical protein